MGDLYIYIGFPSYTMGGHYWYEFFHSCPQDHYVQEYTRLRQGYKTRVFWYCTLVRIIGSQKFHAMPSGAVRPPGMMQCVLVLNILPHTQWQTTLALCLPALGEYFNLY